MTDTPAEAHEDPDERLRALHEQIESGRYDAVFTDAPSDDRDALADELAERTSEVLAHLDEARRAAARQAIASDLGGDEPTD